MASAEQTTATAKPPPITSQEPAAVSLQPAAVHAYYSAAAPPLFSPPVWASQMMSPYGTPFPYPPIYHPVYAHPSVATVAGYPAAELGSDKSKGKSGGGAKITSSSADDCGTQSDGVSGSDDSSESRDNGHGSQDAARKRLFNEAIIEGETSKPIPGVQNNEITTESYYSGRQRKVSKLPVSAPGRTTLPSPATTLNIGTDVRSGTHGPKVRANSANMASGNVGANGVMTEHHWIPDERELKRERRKQSNRESARRSRLRKQQECEDLAKKVAELNSENAALKIELEQLNKVCEDLETENASITDNQTKELIGGGKVANGLYYLDVPPFASAAVSTVCWHQRLGHPPLSMLRTMLPGRTKSNG